MARARRSCDASRWRSTATAGSPTRGLPTCRPALLQSTDPRTAPARCRPALVGRGFIANVEFPNRARSRSTARCSPSTVACTDGRRSSCTSTARLPVEVTVVLAFTIRHPKQGKFGTVLSTKIPRLASDLGYVTDVALVFNRQYRFRGKDTASSAPAAPPRPASPAPSSPSPEGPSPFPKPSRSSPP